MEISSLDCYKILTEKMHPEAVRKLRVLCRNPSFSTENLLKEFYAEKKMKVIPEKLKAILARGLSVMKEIEMMRN